MATGNNRYLTEVDIRMHLLDADPAANELLGQLEFTHESITHAMTVTVDVWNDMPPDIRRHGVNTFPYRSILLDGVCGHLMLSLSVRMRRNQLGARIAGGSVDPNEKASEVQKTAMFFLDRSKAAMRVKKGELNRGLAWGVA